MTGLQHGEQGLGYGPPAADTSAPAKWAALFAEQAREMRAKGLCPECGLPSPCPSGHSAGPVRVLVALDIRPAQALDLDDLVASIRARVEQEAGYLDPDGDPITPLAVTVAVVEFPSADPEDDLPALTEDGLRGVYNVGIEGIDALGGTE